MTYTWIHVAKDVEEVTDINKPDHIAARVIGLTATSWKWRAYPNGVERHGFCDTMHKAKLSAEYALDGAT